MTAMAHAITSRSPVRFAARAGLAVLCWTLAAVAVLMVHSTFDPASPHLAVILKSCSIVVAAFACIRLLPDCTIDHALIIGVTWLLLAIIAEVAVSSSTGHAWFGLLGSPSTPYSRDVLLVVWTAAPAVFARSGGHA
ncbi:MAG TPA: hypothetical protein VLV78_21890 [Thermoanaerobaculia bacterium]|nr:hypothetical protein [Thermoanaerobaculia bacterium]